MRKYDVAIIGAGPGGIMAAITASQCGKRVVLVDKNSTVGRKLLSTGNGRCNLTNKVISVNRYHGAYPDFIEFVIGRFDQNAVISFFRKLGLILKEEDCGRMFPRTNQASSVVEVLSQKLNSNSVHVLLDSQVSEIEKPDDWLISFQNGKNIKSEKLIIATGGRAAHYLGSTGDGLHWAKKFGHSIVLTHAALVPIETVETWPKEVQGTKVEAHLEAVCCGSVICESSGDLLFTSYGLSGLSVLALSGKIADCIRTDEVKIYIDLFHDISECALDKLLSETIKNGVCKTINEALIGILPGNLVPLIIRECGIAENSGVKTLSEEIVQMAVRKMKKLSLTVSKLRPFKEAQVTSGGVDAHEIDKDSMESKITKNLYFAGEVIDVDGDSGGFNLQWAWSSGFVAGGGSADTAF